MQIKYEQLNFTLIIIFGMCSYSGYMNRVTTIYTTETSISGAALSALGCIQPKLIAVLSRYQS